MRKSVLSAIVIIVLVLLAAPYFMGLMTQSAEKKFIASANKKLANKQSKLAPAQQKVIAKFIIQDKIFHGPLFFSKDSDGSRHLGFGRAYVTAAADVDNETQEKLTALGLTLNGQHLMTRNGVMTFGGAYDMQGYSDGLTYNSHDGKAHLVWDGLTFDFVTNFRRGQGTLELKHMQGTKDKHQFTLPAIRLSTDSSYQDGLYIGDTDITIPSLTVLKDNKKVLDIAGFVSQSSSDITDGLLAGSTKLGVQKLTVAGNDYGPANISFSADNIDQATFSKIKSLSEKIRETHDAAHFSYQFSLQDYHRGWLSSDATIALTISEPNPSARAMEQMDALAQRTQAMLLANQSLALLPDLFNRGAVLQFKAIDLKTAKGIVSSHGKVQFPKSNPDETINLMTLGKKAHANLYLKLPLGVAQDAMTFILPPQITSDSADGDEALMMKMHAKQTLEKWVDKGFITNQGNEYEFKLVYADGKLTLNGKTFDFRQQTHQDNASTADSDKPASSSNHQSEATADADHQAAHGE